MCFGKIKVHPTQQSKHNKQSSTDSPKVPHMVTASSSSPQLSSKQDNNPALDTHTLVPCCILVKFQETCVRDKESVPGAASSRS